MSYLLLLIYKYTPLLNDFFRTRNLFQWIKYLLSISVQTLPNFGKMEKFTIFKTCSNLNQHNFKNIFI